MSVPLISILTFLPLAGGLVLIWLPGQRAALARGLALAFSFGVFALSLLMWSRFDSTVPSLQFQERWDWITMLNVEYRAGIDGLSLVMVLLTSLLVPFSLLATPRTRENAPLYYGLTLLLQSGLLGTFTTWNFFHWFLFWELSLIPAFFLVRFWGGPRKESAATMFFIYTMVGSIALLLSFLAMYLATGTFDFQKLASLGSDGTLARALQDKLQWTGLTARHLSLLVFVGVFLGFAVKTPLVPFHGWLPLTYSEAPVSTTMLLTGLMSKMGVYGFLRILLPLFPEELRALQVPLLSLAVLSIVFSAGASFAQQDLRRLFGFSSINHVGYCLLGVFAVAGTGAGQSPGVYREAALSGVILQMFNHGLTAATLFWFTGMLEERTNGSSYLGDFGGIRQRAPIFCGLMGIALFSSLGLPGLNGFIGEFLIFRGVFPLAPWAAGFAVLGLLITAVVLLTLTQRVFHGPLNSARSGLLDLTLRERLCLAPALLLMLVLGVWPQLLLGPISSTVINMISWTE